jgi:hypothetical protein
MVSLASLNNVEEITSTEMVEELDDGDAALSSDREIISLRVDTRAGPSIIEDANPSAEGTDKKTLENIDAMYRGSLRTASLTPGALESYTQDNDAEMTEVSDRWVLVEKLGS